MCAAIKKCPECDSINLTYDPHLGEIICNDCGLVVEEKMVDTSQEVTGSFNKSDNYNGLHFKEVKRNGRSTESNQDVP